MADQKRWFKLWCSAPSDEDLQLLSPALRWAWAALGCYIKEHGTRGVVKVSPRNQVLIAQMGIDKEQFFVTVKQFPHVQIEEGKTANDELTVTWENWHKYQEDSTVSERVSRLRSKRRGEEKREEENKKRGDIKRFIDWFFEKYQERFGKKYLVSGGKDGETVKRLLGTFSLNELIALGNAFFASNDPYIATAGYSIGVFSSQVNKLNSLRLEAKSSAPPDLRTPTEKLRDRQKAKLKA